MLITREQSSHTILLGMVTLDNYGWKPRRSLVTDEESVRIQSPEVSSSLRKRVLIFL